MRNNKFSDSIASSVISTIVRFGFIAFIGLFYMNIAIAKPLYIEIAGGDNLGIPITILPLDDNFPTQDGYSREITGVISNDLRSSGQFKLIGGVDNGNTADTSKSSSYNTKYWQSKGSEYLISGKLTLVGRDNYTVDISLISVYRTGDAALLSLKFENQKSQNFRALSHYISDKIFEKLIGVPGIFSTRIAYITMEQRKNEIINALTISDSDGFNDRVLLETNYPLMSPAWSPDGKKIAFVSFDRKRASVKIVSLHDGVIQDVSHFPGINGAPKWSPDGQSLALVLSKTGAPKIYAYNIGTKNLTQLTYGSSIDTEPFWTPDGQHLVFTSNMGGKPQIYKVNLQTGKTERLTFVGDYNATPSITPDGKNLVFMHKSDRGNFNIAIQSLVSGKLRILTRANQDESPTLAPNGMMILYGSQEEDRYVLGAVSLDGRFQMRLPLRNGSVKDPAWSPFLIGKN